MRRSYDIFLGAIRHIFNPENFNLIVLCSDFDLEEEEEEEEES